MTKNYEYVDHVDHKKNYDDNDIKYNYDDDDDDDVQVLVVVDGPMVRYHGKGVRHYVLTLMHIVSHQEHQDHNKNHNHDYHRNHQNHHGLPALGWGLKTKS